MEQPSGFVDLNYPNHVCHLKKAVYGLRQAPCTWYAQFLQFLLSHSFLLCQTDTSLFVQHASNSITILLVYVDDILLTGNDSEFINQIMSAFHRNFDMQSLGSLKQFIGIDFTFSRSTMILS